MGVNIVFISGVELGCFAIQGILDSTSYQQRMVRFKAIFSLDQSKSAQTVGYCTFGELAELAGAPLIITDTIKTGPVIEQIRKFEPDFIFIIGWSELAPAALLNIPQEKHGSPHRHAQTHGCVGVHPTLLPLGRGRAPIPWAIIKGLTQSGVSMFYLEEGADTGDIIVQHPFTIDFHDDAGSIYKKVSQIHYTLVKEQIDRLVNGTANRTPQDHSRATVWKKRRPEDGIIDWTKPRHELYNWVRALTRPYPGAFTFLSSDKITVWRAAPGDAHPGTPGTISALTETGVVVQCGDGEVILLELQFNEDPPLPAPEFAARYALQIGQRFVSPTV